MNEYLKDVAAVESAITMDSATAEAVFNTEISKAEDKMHLARVSDMLDEVGADNIPAPAMDLIMDTVSKEALNDAAEKENGTSESAMIGAAIGFGIAITSQLVQAIVNKILSLKANKRIAEMKNLTALVEGKKIDSNVSTEALARRKGLVNLYSQGGSSKDIVNSFGKVEEAMNELESSLSDKMEMSDLMKAIDKAIFVDPINIKSIGKSVLALYGEGIGVYAEKDLKYYFFVSGEAKSSLVDDIVKDAKKNLTESAINASLSDYESAVYHMQKTSDALSKKFDKVVKERGDGFFKRWFGNKAEKKALKNRQTIMFNIAYKNFVMSYAGYIKDVHGLLKDLSK